MRDKTIGFIGDSIMMQLYHAALGFFSPKTRVPVEGRQRVKACNDTVTILWSRCNRFDKTIAQRMLSQSDILVANWGQWYETDARHTSERLLSRGDNIRESHYMERTWGILFNGAKVENETDGERMDSS